MRQPKNSVLRCGGPRRRRDILRIICIFGSWCQSCSRSTSFERFIWKRQQRFLETEDEPGSSSALKTCCTKSSSVCHKNPSLMFLPNLNSSKGCLVISQFVGNDGSARGYSDHPVPGNLIKRCFRRWKYLRSVSVSVWTPWYPKGRSSHN